MVDSAGGRTQLAQLSCCAIVLLVLLFASAPMAHLSVAVLAAVVFLIGVELIDIKGLGEIMLVRRIEFALALLTAAAVVVFGVEQAIALAMLASIIDHLRHGYAPRTQVLTREPGGHWRAVAATAEVRTRKGLVIYRFPSSLYYANAHKLAADLAAFASSSAPLDWFCVDCSALSDIDFSAAQTLRRGIQRFSEQHTRVVFCSTDRPSSTSSPRTAFCHRRAPTAIPLQVRSSTTTKPAINPSRSDHRAHPECRPAGGLSAAGGRRGVGMVKQREWFGSRIMPESRATSGLRPSIAPVCSGCGVAGRGSRLTEASRSRSIQVHFVPRSRHVVGLTDSHCRVVDTPSRE